MIRPLDAIVAMSLLLLLCSVLVIAEGDLIRHNAGANATTSSSILKKQTGNWGRPKPPGCWKMPWICKRGAPPMARMRCCKNQCVDVSSDPDHCGLCWRRCPFTWQCCFGKCVNTNISPFNCGRCGNRCPFKVHCVYGMCGYAQPSTPLPFPLPPRHAKPPRPSPAVEKGDDAHDYQPMEMSQ